jgi:2-polyprenyl-6-methoxyphenol hydroxylase-like FAD-dependent oxidoreductase
LKSEIFDIIVVGRGPVGLVMAATAAQLGLKTAIVEKHRDLYGLPRAGHVDHEIVRLFQSLDVAKPMLEDSYPTTEYVWVNAKGETLLEFDWGAKGISGYNSDFMQFQPVFENALSEKVQANPLVAHYLQYEGQDFTDHGDHIEITLAKTKLEEGDPRPIATDDKIAIRGRYLVACDGANSGIRNRLGVERDDLGFNEKWLVIDARKKRELTMDFDCGQICDPKRPVTVLPLGKRHRRWEWAVLPNENPEDLLKPEKAWELLGARGITQDDVEIVRHLIYTFEARHAVQWRFGRIFLMGDAAHTTPPFMGQGMCSGMRDAKNLVWKIDLVLRGLAEDILLDTYEPERSPHTKDWTTISLEAGKVPCTLDEKEAEERDERFRNGWKPPMPDFPYLKHGIVDLNTDGSTRGLAGTLSLQAHVEKDGRTELLDEFYPATKFVVMSTKGDPAGALTAAQRAILDKIGVHYVNVGRDTGADVIDAEGAYHDYFSEHGIEAIVVRPDFYVFGAVARLDALPALIDGLLGKLELVEA